MNSAKSETFYSGVSTTSVSRSHETRDTTTRGLTVDIH